MEIYYRGMLVDAAFVGKHCEARRCVALKSLVFSLVLLVSGCEDQGPRRSIDVVISNDSDVNLGRCDVWFGPSNVASVGRRPAGTSFTHVDIVVQEFIDASMKVVFEDGEELQRNFSVEFMNEISEPHVELDFVVDHETDSIHLRVVSILKGGEEKELRVIEGTEE